MKIRPLLVLLLAPLAVSAQAAPRTGADVLARMRAAYDGKWYHTLTFTQKTTMRRPDGQEVVETWYESLRHTPQSGVQLRIDRGDPTQGNGLLFTADSTWVVRGGQLATTRPTGNEFLPLIEGVYVQPLERTLREVGAMHVDLSTVRADRFEGRPVWVVGAAAGDSTSPQFWVDAERNVLVRMLIAARAPGQPPLDVLLGGYEPLGGGWLATRVTIRAGGVPVQTEEYSGWRADPPLAAELFDVARWTAAPHWAKP